MPAIRKAEACGQRYGYRRSWVPPALMQKADAELGLDLEFIIAHLMLHKPAGRDEARTIYTIRQDAATFEKAHQFSSFRREAVLRQT